VTTRERLRERAQKAAIRYARATRELFDDTRRGIVVATEIEGTVVVSATGLYGRKLAKLVEQRLHDEGEIAFFIERPNAERIKTLVPTRKSSVA